MKRSIVTINGTLRAARYSLSFAAESLCAANLFATAEILKKVVRNSGTSICNGGANAARVEQ